MTIDITKPLELSDGTPMVFNRRVGSGEIQASPAEGHTFKSANGHVYRPGNTGGVFDIFTGRHCASTHVIRNVAAAPTLDTSKPLELSDGTPVELFAVEFARIRVRIPAPHDLAGNRPFLKDGTRPKGLRRQDLTLRNRKETPVTTLDLSKPLQTREGRAAKFVASASDGRLIFEITYPFSSTNALAYRNADGRISAMRDRQDPDDVINKPEPEVARFFNVYEDGKNGDPHVTRLQAERYSKVGKTRVGILAITKRGDQVLKSDFYGCVPYKRTNAAETSSFVALR